jgi:large subunit ribosomal protein L10
MARPEKVAEVQAITERLEAAQSLVLADFTGLTVQQMTEFRVTCRANQIDCRVVKNRLAKIACDNADTTALKDHFVGPTAIMFGPESQVDPAKILVAFAKTNKAMEIKGGYVDGQYLDADKVVALSKVPSRDELLAKMMGSINSPATGLAMCLNGVASGLVRCIDAIGKQKAEEAN